MKVMSFNLRSDFILDFKNRWDKRKHIVYEIIDKYDCDIIGVQEVTNKMFNDIKENFDEFEIVKDPGELDFIGGLVGSLGYDYIRYTEVLPDDNPDEIGIETIQLMLADKFIAINHTAETFTAVVLGED